MTGDVHPINMLRTRVDSLREELTFLGYPHNSTHLLLSRWLCPRSITTEFYSGFLNKWAARFPLVAEEEQSLAPLSTRSSEQLFTSTPYLAAIHGYLRTTYHMKTQTNDLPWKRWRWVQVPVKAIRTYHQQQTSFRQPALLWLDHNTNPQFWAAVKIQFLISS